VTSRARIAALLALAIAGCAGVGPGAAAPDATAQLAVDVYGFDAPSVATAPFSVSVERGERGPEIVAVGRAGEGFVAVPAGVLTLVVHLDPPERVGPFQLAAGAAARVRVLDDATAATPSRTWRLERGEEAVGRAFPPPETLPEPRR
jgi:hypothetical protein